MTLNSFKLNNLIKSGYNVYGQLKMSPSFGRMFRVVELFERGILQTAVEGVTMSKMKLFQIYPHEISIIGRFWT